MKLTRLQANVIDALKNGWELGRSATSEGRWWLQQGGLGRGGKTIDVHTNTALALMKRGLIENKRWGFPASQWGLKGKKP